jgi:hypothetical protein
VLSALEDQDAAPARRKGGRDRGAPHSRSDDDDIRVWQTPSPGPFSLAAYLDRSNNKEKPQRQGFYGPVSGDPFFRFGIEQNGLVHIHREVEALAGMHIRIGPHPRDAILARERHRHERVRPAGSVTLTILVSG